MDDDWQPGHDSPVTPAEDVEGIDGGEPFIGPPGTCFGEGWLPEMAAGLRKASAKTSSIRGGPANPASNTRCFGFLYSGSVIPH
jgi:hypothetical protein